MGRRQRARVGPGADRGGALSRETQNRARPRVARHRETRRPAFENLPKFAQVEWLRTKSTTEALRLAKESRRAIDCGTHDILDEYMNSSCRNEEMTTSIFLQPSMALPDPTMPLRGPSPARQPATMPLSPPSLPRYGAGVPLRPAWLPPPPATLATRPATLPRNRGDAGPATAADLRRRRTARPAAVARTARSRSARGQQHTDAISNPACCSQPRDMDRNGTVRVATRRPSCRCLCLRSPVVRWCGLGAPGETDNRVPLRRQESMVGCRFARICTAISTDGRRLSATSSLSPSKLWPST